MDGWKALVMVVAIVAIALLGAYIFNEVKEAKIMQAKGEAVAGVFKDIRGVIPFTKQ